MILTIFFILHRTKLFRCKYKIDSLVSNSEILDATLKYVQASPQTGLKLFFKTSRVICLFSYIIYLVIISFKKSFVIVIATLLSSIIIHSK